MSIDLRFIERDARGSNELYFYFNIGENNDKNTWSSDLVIIGQSVKYIYLFENFINA